MIEENSKSSMEGIASDRGEKQELRPIYSSKRVGAVKDVGGGINAKVWRERRNLGRGSSEGEMQRGVRKGSHEGTGQRARWSRKEAMGEEMGEGKNRRRALGLVSAGPSEGVSRFRCRVRHL